MSDHVLKQAFGILRSFDPRKKHLEDEIAKRRDGIGHNRVGEVNALCDAVLRFDELLCHMISHVSTVTPTKMERAVLRGIQLTMVAFLRGMPAHAAVSEGVSLLPPNHKAKGLTNAILRRITEIFRSEDLGHIASLKDFGPRSVPITEGRVIRADTDYFPAHERDCLRLACGIPAWIERDMSSFLSDEELDQVMLAMTQLPLTWFRLRQNAEATTAQFADAEGAVFRENAIGLKGEAAGALLGSNAFRHGECTVQDYSAQLPISRAPIEKGWSAVDFCAAPGGKTAQIAEAVGKEGRVIAFDVNEAKLKKIKNTLDRLSINNVAGAFGDGTCVELPEMGKFDFVMVDAPCSNTGVMARRIEVRHRLQPEDVKGLRETQLALLRNAAKHLRKGGMMVWSTCSLLDEENGQLVRQFLDEEGGEDSGWFLNDEELTLPEPGVHDGGYFARLTKPKR